MVSCVTIVANNMRIKKVCRVWLFVLLYNIVPLCIAMDSLDEDGIVHNIFEQSHSLQNAPSLLKPRLLSLLLSVQRKYWQMPQLISALIVAYIDDPFYPLTQDALANHMQTIQKNVLSYRHLSHNVFYFETKKLLSRLEKKIINFDRDKSWLPLKNCLPDQHTIDSSGSCMGWYDHNNFFVNGKLRFVSLVGNIEQIADFDEFATFCFSPYGNYLWLQFEPRFGNNNVLAIYKINEGHLEKIKTVDGTPLMFNESNKYLLFYDGKKRKKDRFAAVNLTTLKECTVKKRVGPYTSQDVKKSRRTGNPGYQGVCFKNKTFQLYRLNGKDIVPVDMPLEDDVVDFFVSKGCVGLKKEDDSLVFYHIGHADNMSKFAQVSSVDTWRLSPKKQHIKIQKINANEWQFFRINDDKLSYLCSTADPQANFYDDEMHIYEKDHNNLYKKLVDPSRVTMQSLLNMSTKPK